MDLNREKKNQISAHPIFPSNFMFYDHSPASLFALFLDNFFTNTFSNILYFSSTLSSFPILRSFPSLSIFPQYTFAKKELFHQHISSASSSAIFVSFSRLFYHIFPQPFLQNICLTFFLIIIHLNFLNPKHFLFP